MDIILRAEANRQGLNTYFTGEPCKKGHIAPRWVHSYSCLECHKFWTSERRGTDSYKNYNRKHYEESRVLRPERIMLTTARNRARKSDLPCTITANDIKNVYPKDNLCPVLGIELRSNFDANGSYCDNSPSLDKIIPELGYIKGNIIIMSAKANRIKNNETDPEVFFKIGRWMQGVKG